MKFKTTDGSTTMISLTSGHTAKVTGKGTDLHKRFHREALARGCVPVGVPLDDDQGLPQERRMDLIRSAIERMLDSDEDGMFTADGKPNTKKLSALCGFTVSNSERDGAWESMQEGSGEGGEGDGTGGEQ